VDEDVREIWGRVQLALVAIACGLGGIAVAVAITRGLSLPGTSYQRDYFFLAACCAGFLLFGTAGGLVYTLVDRCLRARANRPAPLPRAIILRR
jgi:hypothetical protein